MILRICHLMKTFIMQPRSYLVLTVALLALFIYLPDLPAHGSNPEPVPGSAQESNAESQEEKPDQQDPNSSNQSGNLSESKAGGHADNPSKDEEAKHLSEHQQLEYLIPKPGQRIVIAGFADQKPATLIDGAAVPDDKPGAYHRAEMRLTGSMCYACLKEFQDKLKLVLGVERTRVEKSNQASIQSFSPGLQNWADAVIYYDANKLDFVDLRAFMRRSGYFPYKVVDKETDSVPPEGQKKI